jgi:chemotaxis protein histidine kinase CheA/ActR/RegA family two-component response regulator
MSSYSSEHEQLQQAFMAEAKELLQTMERTLLSLLDEKTTEKVHALMRSAHTLKGSAASVGEKTIETVAHHLEDVFQALYPPELEIDPPLGALLLDAYECLRTCLSATLMGLSYNEAEILARTASIFAQLQVKLGDFFGREVLLPSSEELGFDAVHSIFSESVLQDLQQLQAELASQNQQQLQAALHSQAEFFLELATTYNLPGLAEIAQGTLKALQQHPDKVLEIAREALENFQQARAAVLGGDRTRGGEISAKLQQWSQAGPTITVVSEPKVETKATEKQQSPFLPAPSEPVRSFLPAPTAKLPKAISQDSPVDRILQSIWIGNPETSYRNRCSKQPTSPPATSQQTQPLSVPSIRVAIAQLDRLSHTIGELLIYENQQTLQWNRARQAARDTLLQFLHCQQQLGQVYTWCERYKRPDSKQQLPAEVAFLTTTPQRPCVGTAGISQSRFHFDALEMDRYTELHILLQTFAESMVQLGERIEAFNSLVEQSRFHQGKGKQLLSGAQEDLLQARMVPLKTVLNRFPRLLQQMAAAHQKPVELKLGGMEVLVDKAICEQLYDPLLHMIRNAFDHGIEPVELRRQQGKPETGTIAIQAYHQGNRTTIEVQDDGRGLKWESIRQRVIDKQLLTPQQANNLSEAQLAEFLFEPGFSTAQEIGELSGRGMGLNVVRTQLQALQGSISVRSVQGQGTTFILQLPLSLTTARLLVCQSQGITYALLSEGISQVILPQPKQIQTQASLHKTGGTQKFLQWQQQGQAQQLVCIYPLASLLDYKYPLPIQDSNWTLSPFPVQQRQTVEPLLLLLPQKEQYLCLQVDRILVEQELVIKSLGSVVTLPSFIQGYSVLGNGSLTLVIDPLELVRQTWQASDFSAMPPLPAAQHPPESTPTPQLKLVKTNAVALSSPFPTVLVVEDSAVQRQSLVMTLSKAGYQVLQAKDGREAIALLLADDLKVDLIVSDIEMPRMNGFELLEHCRSLERLSKIPVVMLTTRGGQKHRQLAFSLGAKAYLTKPYSEQEFLASIAQLLNPS